MSRDNFAPIIEKCIKEQPQLLNFFVNKDKVVEFLNMFQYECDWGLKSFLVEHIEMSKPIDSEYSEMGWLKGRTLFVTIRGESYYEIGADYISVKLRFAAVKHASIKATEYGAYPTFKNNKLFDNQFIFCFGDALEIEAEYMEVISIEKYHEDYNLES